MRAAARRHSSSGPLSSPSSDDHEGFVAGHYCNGAYSDIWTDVRRCAERTFLADAPACECGWRGSDNPTTPEGYYTAQRSWFDDHCHQLTKGVKRSWRATDFLTT